MFCTKCGERIPDGATFCPKCGNKVGQTSSTFSSKLNEAGSEVVNGINETVDSVSKEVKSVADNIGEGAKKVGNEFSKKAGDVNESLKNFDFNTLTSKKSADLGSIIACVAPIALVLLSYGISLICRILLVPYNMTYIEPFWYLFVVVSKIFNILFLILKIAALVVTIGTIVLLICRMLQYGEKDNINFFQIVGCSVALIALLGFYIYSAPGLKWIGLLSLVLGLDFIIKAFIKKEPIYGNLDLVGDFATAKENLANAKAQKAQNKENQEFANMPMNQNTVVKADVVADGNESYFDGTGGELFVKYLLLVLLSVVTCGLGTPFALVKLTSWRLEHTVIDGKRLTFNGTATQLWGLWIKWWLLSLITCGIYSYFATVDYYKWQAKHTGYEGSMTSDGIYPGSTFVGNSFEYLGYSLLTGLVISVTCGIAYPWMECIMTSWKYKNTTINGQKLMFNCTGGELFGTWFITSLLTVITCGIYGPWATCKMNNLIISHEHVDRNYNQF